ncbi:MAG: A/G-specific adenine glycosylase [Deltaproteobacteria bacterium]|nr:A/G-specific adenine glycosylase [Deltaproteobacteria bacterium]
MRREASLALLEWFQAAARRMEWRETEDPYRIWISEIMLQQTRVDTMTPYYRRFLRLFPTLRALAGAPLDRVLKAWEGLGYYSRARNLHKSARILCDAHGGRLPASVDALTALPGVGKSTAGAIAAIAYRQDVPILDANAKRVLARFHAVREELRRPAVERSLWEHSRRMILPGKGRETALAMMDLGATVCTPRNPECGACPLARWCRARRQGLQDAIPRKGTPKALPHHDVVLALVGNREGKLLIGRRPEDGFLGGLWEFPGGRRKPGESLAGALRREIRKEVGIGIEVLEKIGVIRHGYSHFRVTLHAYRCRKAAGRVRTSREWKWVAPGALGRFALPRADRKLLELIAGRQPHEGQVRERGTT